MSITSETTGPVLKSSGDLWTMVFLIVSEDSVITVIIYFEKIVLYFEGTLLKHKNDDLLSSFVLSYDIIVM